RWDVDQCIYYCLNGVVGYSYTECQTMCT
uniref:Conotoxin as14b n=1 Tax=Conus cancellatus TaxID=289020 RepID=CLEB_CONCF|nr:RecName: Full=Conotoxin as14b; AltName: Full=Conotoxin AsXIVB; Flags: Precursor [Conus cancellatus]